MGQILLPPSYEDVHDQLLFLAGPIKGARDWQSEAIAFLHAQRPGLLIASPRRPSVDSSYRGHFPDDERDAQNEWEFRHLEMAMRHGVVLFWFARELDHDCHRAFAQQTRIEFGDTLRLAHQGRGQIVVGGEEGCSGLRAARWRLNRLLPQATFHHTLADTCAAALAALD